MSRETRLKEVISPLKSKYDYILIDCPPALGLLTINAFVASDEQLIPVQAEYFALEGLTKLLETMNLVKSRLNPAIEINGAVLTMYDKRTSLSDQVSAEVRKHFGDKVYKTVIPRSVRLAEAPSHGKSILDYDRKGKGATAYLALSRELIAAN